MMKWYLVKIVQDKIYTAEIHNIYHHMVQRIKKINQKRLKYLHSCFKINYVCGVSSSKFLSTGKALLVH